MMIFLCAIMAALSAIASAGLLDPLFIPTTLLEKYQLASTKEGYRFNLEEPNGSKREEVGMVVNPGTPAKQLFEMRAYASSKSRKTKKTYSKTGLNPICKIQKCGLSIMTLKSLPG